MCFQVILTIEMNDRNPKLLFNTWLFVKVMVDKGKYALVKRIFRAYALRQPNTGFGMLYLLKWDLFFPW